MSIFRHGAEHRTPVVRTQSVGFSSGYHWRVNGLDWGVLVWASRGVATIELGPSVRVIAPQQALWIPPHAAHSVRLSGRGTLRQVYAAPSRSAALPPAPRVVFVTPLLREVMRHICALGVLHDDVPAERRLLDLLADDVAMAAPAPADSSPLSLPMPSDPRACRAAESVREACELHRTVADIARAAHTSVRTLERLFHTETGLSFGNWRRRARIIHAMALLADGTSVTAVGLRLGYASTSAFVSAFRNDVGLTPGRYARATRARSIPPGALP